MSHLVVVYKPKNWPFHLPNVEVVSAKEYLTDSSYSQRKNIKVYNLSRSYRYQSLGYYVSLLAAARGHAPIPSVITIQDLKSQAMIRGISDDLDDLIQKNLAGLQSSEFTLSIYFGHNIAKKYDRLPNAFKPVMIWQSCTILKKKRRHPMRKRCKHLSKPPHLSA